MSRKPTPSQLAASVSATGSNFFTPGNMRFAGDTMSNYAVNGPIEIQTHTGETVTVWELVRKRPVKNGLRASAYFDCDTFAQRFKAR